MYIREKATPVAGFLNAMASSRAALCGCPCCCWIQPRDSIHDTSMTFNQLLWLNASPRSTKPRATLWDFSRLSRWAKFCLPVSLLRICSVRELILFLIQLLDFSVFTPNLLSEFVPLTLCKNGQSLWYHPLVCEWLFWSREIGFTSWVSSSFETVRFNMWMFGWEDPGGVQWLEGECIVCPSALTPAGELA